MAHFAFLGTPEFAIPTLDGLHQFCLEHGHTVSFVVCQPDKPSHRGKQVHAPPVKLFAQERKVEVVQPSTLKKGTAEGDALFDLFQKEQIDIAVVVAYGRIIPKRLLDLPPRGFVNVHASLLPRWRGAAPIQRAIEAGDTETGVSIMDLVLELDAGDVYCKEHIPILADDDAATLSAKLAELGKNTLLECLSDILTGNIPKVPQPHEGITHAPPLHKNEGEINWQRKAVEIVNQYRAMQPWPGTYTFHRGRPLRLFGAFEIMDSPGSAPGTIIYAKDHLAVATVDGAVGFKEAQLEGKRRMPIRELINGYPLAEKEILGR